MLDKERYVVSAIVVIAVIFSDVLIKLFGITTNTVTVIVAIGTIAMMAISVVLTEKALKKTTSKGLNDVNDTLKTMAKEQSQFYKVIYNYLYPQPKITLRKEIRPYLIIFRHYWLWVYNQNARAVKLEILPKPPDNSGMYQFNQELQKDFYVSDATKLQSDRQAGMKRIVKVTCMLSGDR